MRAGELDQSIQLKRKVATRDDKGGEVVTYSALATRSSAKADPVRGRQFEALQQAQSDIESIFTIYYRTDVQPDWRVEHRGVDYEIIGVPIDVNAQKRWLELRCRTSQNA